MGAHPGSPVSVLGSLGGVHDSLIVMGGVRMTPAHELIRWAT
jgi:hypothetical protein